MIKWKEVYSTGVKEIDDDHKRLFDILNGLEESIINLRHEDISNLSSTLADYSSKHFSHEMIEMINHNYPKELIDQHKKEHDSFLNGVYELESKSMSLSFGMMMHTPNFLKDWVIGHLLGSDKEFAEFLKNEVKTSIK